MLFEHQDYQKDDADFLAHLEHQRIGAWVHETWLPGGWPICAGGLKEQDFGRKVKLQDAGYSRVF